MSNQQLPIICDLNALPDQVQHAQVGAELLAQAQTIEELDNGYAIEFPITALMLVAEFISNERLCCPFFTFQIYATAAAATLQLELSGASGVKTFLEHELLPLLPVAVDS